MATPCALNEDTLVLVFDHFDSVSSGTDRVALAQSALVCHTWYEIAVRALWRSLHHITIYPLYHILSPFTWFDENGNRPYGLQHVAWRKHLDKMLEIKPWMLPERWARFLFHANLVRIIPFWNIRENECQILRLLIEHNGGESFLPCLQGIRLWNQVSFAGDILFSMVPPTMTELHFGLVLESRDELMATLTRLATELPSLASFGLSTSSEDYLAVLPIISSFASLRHLNLGRTWITPEDTTRTPRAWLSSLQSFQGSVKDFEGCKEVIDMPHLRKLHVSGCGADPVGLLTHWRTPSLSELRVALRNYDTSDVPIHTHLLPPTAKYPALRTLWVESHGLPSLDHTDQGQQTSTPDLVQMIAPVLAAAKLDLIMVTYEWPVFLSDAGVLAMAKAWHALRVLRLELPHSAPTLPSLTALAHLSRHCPQLVQLALTLNVFFVPDIPSSDAPSSHQLRQFELLMCEWATDDAPPKDVARFLYALFPCIDVEYEDQSERAPTGSTYGRQWKEMWAEVRALQIRPR